MARESSVCIQLIKIIPQHLHKKFNRYLSSTFQFPKRRKKSKPRVLFCFCLPYFIRLPKTFLKKKRKRSYLSPSPSHHNVHPQDFHPPPVRPPHYGASRSLRQCRVQVGLRLGRGHQQIHLHHPIVHILWPLLISMLADQDLRLSFPLFFLILLHHFLFRGDRAAACYHEEHEMTA